MKTLTGREASAAACFVDAVVAPGDVLPPVTQTDAVAFIDDYLHRSPPLNRAGLRALLAAAEVGPFLVGPRRARLRRLRPEERTEFLARAERSALAPGLRAIRSIAHMAYYGDLNVMRQLGYDAEANVARARAVRAKEARW